uniref:Uncharacterized protein n=1 Tax=Astyanax mexicanus TaxID=7994 RepID=A0A3B1KHA4_ASTMX
MSPTLSPQWAHEQVAMVAGNGGYTWCPIWPQKERPIIDPQYDTIPRGDQPATWWQVDYIGLFHAWIRAGFVPH